MAEVICDTSPLQYLHQIRSLHLLSSLVDRIWVPNAVADELAAGRAKGLDLPEVGALAGAMVRSPTNTPLLPHAMELGLGETQVLTLALENPSAIAVVDDRLARRVAAALGVRFTGTLGILLDAKMAGLIPAVTPSLDELHRLGFRIAPATRAAILRLAKE